MARKIEYGRMLHGGDYNPEQWLDRPDILKKDIEYFKKAHINTVSVGIFSRVNIEGGTIIRVWKCGCALPSLPRVTSVVRIQP